MLLQQRNWQQTKQDLKILIDTLSIRLLPWWLSLFVAGQRHNIQDSQLQSNVNMLVHFRRMAAATSPHSNSLGKAKVLGSSVSDIGDVGQVDGPSRAPSERTLDTLLHP